MIEIQKEFAPMTIRFKTKEDLNDLLDICHLALKELRGERMFRGMSDQQTIKTERIIKFMRDIQ